MQMVPKTIKRDPTKMWILNTVIFSKQHETFGRWRKTPDWRIPKILTMNYIYFWMGRLFKLDEDFLKIARCWVVISGSIPNNPSFFIILWKHLQQVVYKYPKLATKVTWSDGVLWKRVWKNFLGEKIGAWIQIVIQLSTYCSICSNFFVMSNMDLNESYQKFVWLRVKI